MRSFCHSFSERNFARYLNSFFLPLYPNKTIAKLIKRKLLPGYTDRFKYRITFNYCLLMLCLDSKYLATLRLVLTCNDQKNAHSNVNITSSWISEPKRTHHARFLLKTDRNDRDLRSSEGSFQNLEPTNDMLIWVFDKRK